MSERDHFLRLLDDLENAAVKRSLYGETDRQKIAREKIIKCYDAEIARLTGELEEIVLHKPDEGDEFAWTQCDGPDDICSDPRQSENWQHAVAVLRRKP